MQVDGYRQSIAGNNMTKIRIPLVCMHVFLITVFLSICKIRKMAFYSLKTSHLSLKFYTPDVFELHENIALMMQNTLNFLMRLKNF